MEYRTMLDLKNSFRCLSAVALSKLLSGDGAFEELSYWNKHSKPVKFDEAVTMLVSYDGTCDCLLQYSILSSSNLICKALMSFGDVSVPKADTVQRAEDISLFRNAEDAARAAVFARDGDYRLERMTNFNRNSGQLVEIPAEFGKVVKSGVRTIAGYLIKESIKEPNRIVINELLVPTKKYQRFCRETATDDGSLFDVFKVLFLQSC